MSAAAKPFDPPPDEPIWHTGRSRILKQCERCGTDFYPWPRGRFCSKSCANSVAARARAAAERARIAALPPTTPEEQAAWNRQMLADMQAAFARHCQYIESQEETG